MKINTINTTNYSSGQNIPIKAVNISFEAKIKGDTVKSILDQRKVAKSKLTDLKEKLNVLINGSASGDIYQTTKTKLLEQIKTTKSKLTNLKEKLNVLVNK